MTGVQTCALPISVAPGYRGDVVLVDPATVTDHATYDDPRRLGAGVHTVLVDGVPTLLDGRLTGALPGRAVR